jgi:ribosomal protein S18 acetylase RimI-like enzyme
MTSSIHVRRAVRDAAIAENVDRVILHVWSFNRDARRFYERLGFTSFHERMAVELGSGPQVSR